MKVNDIIEVPVRVRVVALGPPIDGQRDAQCILVDNSHYITTKVSATGGAEPETHAPEMPVTHDVSKEPLAIQPGPETVVTDVPVEQVANDAVNTPTPVANPTEPVSNEPAPTSEATTEPNPEPSPTSRRR